MDLLNDHAILWLSVIYNSVHVLAPVVVTLTCYLSMMFAVSVLDVLNIQMHVADFFVLHLFAT